MIWVLSNNPTIRSMNEAWENGIETAIEDAGYISIRIDKKTIIRKLMMKLSLKFRDRNS